MQNRVFLVEDDPLRIETVRGLGYSYRVPT
jgi:DNA-binding response OmpR family regulator